MKIAVLSDILPGRAGAEKLTYMLATHYDADIYTGYINLDKVLPEFKNLNVNTFNAPKVPLLMQEFLVRKFRNLHLSNYDAIICIGYYSIYSAIKNHPIIWYSYTTSPLFYSKPKNTSLKVSPSWKIGAMIWKKRIQKYDKKTVKEIDKIVTISEYASQALKDYYNTTPLIINPPADTKIFFNKPQKGYYLIVSRFEPGKRVEIAIEAFKKMPDKTLFIEGSGSMDKYLHNLADGYKNIKFLGRVSTEELLSLYANSIAFIATAHYDEFGMPLVESMASGKPVIAVNQGAYPEVIVNGKTGVLVEGTPEGIISGVNKITPVIAEKMKIDCMERAKEFDINIFYKKWDKLIKHMIHSSD
jgi:glycosyltransferase involved in cell wall biosynthesis